MENERTLYEYLRLFRQDRPEISGYEAFVNSFEASEGSAFSRLMPEAVDYAVLSELLESAERRSLSRTDYFNALVFLRLFFSYLKETHGIEMPEILLPRSFASVNGLGEQGAVLLSHALRRECKRINFCLWLALRTDIPVYSVLRLTPENVVLSDDVLTVKYVPETRKRKKSAPQETELAEVSLCIEPDELWWLTECLNMFSNSPGCISSGTTAPQTRSALQRVLTKAAVGAGFSDVKLADLENTHEHTAENAPKTFFADLSAPADSRGIIAAEDAKLTPLPCPNPDNLQKILKNLPVPVQEHCTRVRQISSFILEFIRAEEWFIDLDLSEYKLLTAVYFHDLGKAALAIDDLYPTRSNRESNKKYTAHVQEGLNILLGETGTDLDAYPANTFAGMLRDVITDHHERPDGKGFPSSKKEDKISFAGRLCAFADALDHAIFVADGMDEVISDALNDMEQSAGTKYDARLLSAVAEHRNVFINFLSELRDYYRNKRQWDAYGMRFEFRPFYSADKAVTAYETHLLLNDPYYGVIDADTILPLMENHPQYSVFVRLQITRLCRILCEAGENGINVPPVIVKVAAREPMRANFFDELFKLFLKYDIHYHQIIFAIDEADAIGRHADMADICAKFKLIGAQVAISGFGGEATLISSLGTISPDYIILKREYADADGNPMRLEFLKTVIGICRKIGTGIFIPESAGRSDIGKLSDMGISAFGESSPQNIIGEDNI